MRDSTKFLHSIDVSPAKLENSGHSEQSGYQAISPTSIKLRELILEYKYSFPDTNSNHGDFYDCLPMKRHPYRLDPVKEKHILTIILLYPVQVTGDEVGNANQSQYVHLLLQKDSTSIAKVVQFGMNNSPATFLRLIKTVGSDIDGCDPILIMCSSA